MDAVELIKNAEGHRYELWVGGRRVSLADFYERDGVVVIPHTETLPAFGGRGFAGQVTRFALDDIRAHERRVDPVCPFVADYIRQNPEYADLVVTSP